MAKKADSKARVCMDCGVDISMRGFMAKRCVVCAEVKKKKSLKRTAHDNRQKYIEKRKADSVSGVPYGITKKQERFIERLLETLEYDAFEILILAKKDGVIKTVTTIELLGLSEASRLIDYLLAIEENMQSDDIKIPKYNWEDQRGIFRNCAHAGVTVRTDIRNRFYVIDDHAGGDREKRMLNTDPLSQEECQAFIDDINWH